MWYFYSFRTLGRNHSTQLEKFRSMKKRIDLKRKIQLVVEEGAGEFATAGRKAPSDVMQIASDIGFEKKRIRTRRTLAHPVLKYILNAAWVFRCILFVLKSPKNAIVLFQAPRAFCGGGKTGRFLLRMLKRVWNDKMIAIVHDLEEMRVWNPGGKDLSTTKALAQTADIIIVHNQKMATRFMENGVDERRIVILQVFDYLTSAPMAPATKFERCVTIAGNLSQKEAAKGKYKSRYLQSLGKISNVKWMLYGPGYDNKQINGENIHYCGCFDPNDLPMHLCRGFGLIWDGDSIETCSGEHGEYLRINNPHKLSLYMACGLPVVIWRDAAEAEFVKNEDVGFTIGSLRELGARLDAMSEAEYERWSNNARIISKRVRTGYYTKRAIDEAQMRLQES